MTDRLSEYQEPLQKITCTPLSIAHCNAVANIFILFQLFILLIIACVYANDINNLIKDVQVNMDDLSLILPEVGKTLGIIRQICYSTEYAPYCHVNMTI